jgi:ADP-heptose:LPS heptosyltransferase
MWNKFVIFCFYVFFRLWSRLFPARPVNLSQIKRERILVFSAAGIGDTLTDSVAIGALKESNPLAKIIVVTHTRRAMLVEHNPCAGSIVHYRKSLYHFFKLVKKLRALHPDVIVMLRGNDPDLWPLAYMVNRNAIVSCPVMTRFKFLISHPVEIPEWDQIHGVEQTLRIVRALGAETQNKKLIYAVKEWEANAVFEKAGQMGIDLRQTVVFQLGGGWRSTWRDWPAIYYAELAKLLIQNYDVSLVLTGGPEHEEKARFIIDSIGQGRVVSVIGKMSLAEVAAMLSWCPVLVSTDTGIMHIGFAVCGGVLALIHCNNPASRVGPYDYGHQHLVAQLEPPPGEPVSTAVSMSLLTPATVWPMLRELCERGGLVGRESTMVTGE